MPIDLGELEPILTATAREELLPRFARVERGRKADGSVVTEADVQVQRRLAEALALRWPAIAFLGEEMPASTQADLLSSNRAVWCLDPLDGTSNFAAGIPYFSVSLALLEHGITTAGIVYDPVRDECFSAVRGGGATLNGSPLRSVPAGLDLRHATGLVDYKRLTDDLAARLVTDPPFASQRSFGSVALDWCWIAAGRCHVYLHGRQGLWDYAAGHLVLHEAGGRSSTLSGEDVFVNRLEPRSAVAALDPALFDAWIRWLVAPPAT